jgi:uncharacterized protein (TIGR03437 family)
MAGNLADFRTSLLLMRFAAACAMLMWVCAAAHAGESDALAISANIQAKHIPFATILDPIYDSATGTSIVGYTRCGDSALWTGAYLAAESFRYSVTQSADALQNVKGALAGLKALADLTGDNRLARCIVLTASPYAAGIASEEANNTIHQNPPWFWVDNTSRDQVVGAFFGLEAAYDLVNDAGVKSTVSDLTTRLVGFIAGHQWTPNDDISNTFLVRPEELQMLVQVARHVNPSSKIGGPFFVPPVNVGVLVDVQSISSYFKFNLDYMTFYNLVRLQDNSDNRSAYMIARNYTASHGNPFFNMIDRALNGPDDARDAETRSLLDQWLQRPKRDVPVDNSSKVQVCGIEACQPIPVPMRVPNEFLWQQDPFQLAGGGIGTIEGSGIEYILPYWMARYYGVIAGASGVQSSAAAGVGISASSLASIYGSNLASNTAQAQSFPLPATLGGVSVSITDAKGAQANAPLLYVSPVQVNFEVPDGTATGNATITVNGQSFTAAVQPLAPALFSMNGTGSGVAAALAVAVQAANPQLQTPVTVFQCGSSGCVSAPISLGVDQPVYVSFYSTGIRNRSSLANVSVTVNGTSVPVQYAGPAPNWIGLDQVNVGPLPLSLQGSGEVNVELTADGQTSNTVTIRIQ